MNRSSCMQPLTNSRHTSSCSVLHNLSILAAAVWCFKHEALINLAALSSVLSAPTKPIKMLKKAFPHAYPSTALFLYTVRLHHLLFISLAVRMSEKRKRIALDLETKVAIINDIESGKKQSTICNVRKLPKQTVNTIWNDRIKIRQAFEATVVSNRKRLRTAAYEDVEEALLKWFRLARTQNIPVGGLLLREKADKFAKKLGHNSFQCSVGWLDRFKSRHGIVFRDVCGEAASVDEDVVTHWSGTALPALIASYEPRDVFNADETGIFYRLLPDKTMCFKGDTCHGGKQSKERITAMVCANMDGSEKLPLIVIGKFERPRCFKNVKSLPTDYTFNKKAWMTSAIFIDWLSKLNKRFKAQHRRVLIVVDNCPAHPKITNLESITLAFLPPNATSRLQPCDMGIIKNLKVKYRRLVTKRLIDSVEKKVDCEINILHAMQMLRSAWNDVSQLTIANCFNHAGFRVSMCIGATSQDADQESVSDDDSDYDDDLLLSHLQSKDTTFTDYAAVDDCVETCEIPTEDDIVAGIGGNLMTSTDAALQSSQPPSAVSERDSGDESDSGDMNEPKLADAMTAIDTLQRFLYTIKDSEAAQQHALDIETFIVKSRKLCVRQTTMRDFLQ
jgi:hypothetical protein